MENKECIMYLRKSRADRDFSEEETMLTLKRHKEALLKFAHDTGLHIVKTYEEIVSGDSIAARPEMQKLLTEVETGKYYGVLAMDIQRLGRGNSIDQGIIQNTFKYSGTRIITPQKVYDFSDEFDEEYSEFELFMGRKEYKMTKRRLLNGRLASIREGKWPGGNAPYGYETYKLKGQKGFSLKVIPAQARVVRMIYDWYVNGIHQEDGYRKKAGSYLIAKTLNELGYKNQYNSSWNEGHISKIIGYEVYIGKVIWYNRKEIQHMEAGRVVKSSTKQTDDVKMVYDGLHEAIIDEELFYRAVKIKNERRPHIPKDKHMRNPFCGVLVCQKCGKPMWLRSKDKTDYALFCHNVNCDNKAVYLSVFEDKFIKALKYWTDGYMINSEKYGNVTEDIDGQIKSLELHIDSLIAEKKLLISKLSKAYDLVETGVYDSETFQQRSSIIKKSITDTEESLNNSEDEIKRLRQYLTEKEDLIPKMKSLADAYQSLTVERKNEIITTLFDRIEYKKNKWGRGHSDDFEIKLYPKFPKL